MQVAIIGGGLAGLAAAATLAKADVPVTLIEAGAQLGGRARTVGVEFNSQVIAVDNGQHILLGAYHASLQLLASVGVTEAEAFLRLPLTLSTYTTDKKRVFHFAAIAALPHPFSQLMSILSCAGLSFKARWSIINFILYLKKCRYQLVNDIPLSQLLNQHRQPEQVIRLLWEPLCLAALNTPIDAASARVFLRVLQEAFDKKNTHSDILLPKRDLSQLFAQPISRYIEKKQGRVLLNHRVKSIQPQANGFAVVSKKGVIACSHVIMATSTARLQNLVTELPALAPVTAIAESYSYQPIYTIYLQYASHVKLPQPMLALTNTLSQWVFDRGAICKQPGLIAVIISATGPHQKLSHETLAKCVAQELQQAFPALQKPLWHRVIAEKRATFHCGVDTPRPTNRTAYPNLLLAGDYTVADYPATIEAAVRSGVHAANLIIQS